MTNREIDDLVATKVMGWSIADSGDLLDENGRFVYKFEPSTDIAAAFEVAERVIYPVEITEYINDNAPRWTAKFVDINCVVALCDDDSLPKAICLAALKAEGVDVELL